MFRTRVIRYISEQVVRRNDIPADGGSRLVRSARMRAAAKAAPVVPRPPVSGGDDELVAAARAGDDRALATLLEKYRGFARSSFTPSPGAVGTAIDPHWYFSFPPTITSSSRWW